MATAPPSGAGEGAAPPLPVPPAQEAKPEAKAPIIKAKPIPNRAAKDAAKELGILQTKDAGKELFGGVKRNEKGQFTKLFGQDTEDALGSFEENEAQAQSASEEVPDIHDGMPGEVAPPKPVVKVEAKPGEEIVKPGEEAKEPAKPKIKFADKEYDDLSAAEQEVRTLRGMFKPLNERATAYDRIKAEQAEDRQAALEWTNVARQLLAGSMGEEDVGKLRQQLGISQSGNTPPQNGKGGAGASGLPSPEEIVKGLDLQMFEDLALHPQGGLRVAGEHLAEQILSTVAEKLLPNLEKKYQTSIQPIVADREYQARAANLDSLLTQVGSFKLQDGTFAFPELSDPAAIDEIASVMVEFGRDENDLTTPQGVMQAVALYRMAKGFKSPHPSGGSAQPQPGRTEAVPTPPAHVPAPGAAASIGADNRGGGAGSSGRPRYTGAHARMLDTFDKITAKPDDLFNTLGFSRNPRPID